MQTQLPSRTALKQQAKRLRDALAQTGQTLTHSAALETLAHQHGYRDWNTLHAAAGETMPNLTSHFVPGGWVRGAYLGKKFTGEIVGAHDVGNGFYRLTIRFDEAVDVVDFDSFSSFRKRVNVVVGKDGVSPRKRSDGTPHLVLQM